MKDLAPTPNSCTVRVFQTWVFQTCAKSHWKVVDLPKLMWFASSVRARRRKFLWRLRCLRMSAQVWGKRRGFWPNTWAIERQDWEKRKHGKAPKSNKRNLKTAIQITKAITVVGQLLAVTLPDGRSLNFPVPKAGWHHVAHVPFSECEVILELLNLKLNWELSVWHQFWWVQKLL